MDFKISGVWSHSYMQPCATSHDTEDMDISRNLPALNGKYPSLKIPKILPVDACVNQGKELFEKEVRSPIPEAQVIVKTEPIDLEEARKETRMDTETWRSNITDSHSSSQIYAGIKIKLEREDFKETVNKNDFGTEKQSESIVHNTWRKAGKGIENRNSDSPVFFEQQVQKKCRIKSRQGLPGDAEVSKRAQNENDWKRTVSIGKTKRLSDKHRRHVREYVDEMIGQIRNETDKHNKTKKIQIPKVENLEFEERTAKNVDNVSKYIGLQIAPLKIQKSNLGIKDEGEKKKKRSKSNKDKAKNHETSLRGNKKDTLVENRSSQKMVSMSSSRIGLAKPYHSPHNYGSKNIGNSMAFGWKYQCSFCPTKCSSEYGLRRHLWVHTKMKPFECNHCPMQFIRREHFRHHMNRNHPGLPD